MLSSFRFLCIAFLCCAAVPSVAQNKYMCLSKMGEPGPPVDAPSATEAIEVARQRWKIANSPITPVRCITLEEWMQRVNQHKKESLQADKEYNSRQCGPIPPSISTHPYSDAEMAVMNGCAASLVPADLVYMGAVVAKLDARCGRPDPSTKNDKVGSFMSVALSGTVPGSLKAIATAATIFGQGKCDPALADRWHKGLEKYLETTSTGSGNAFVDSCVHRYNGQWSEQKCQCVATVSRFIKTSVTFDSYSKSYVKDAISNPALGAIIIGRCGVRDY